MDSVLKHGVSTNVQTNRIEQIYFSEFDNTTQVLMRTVLDTGEQQIIDALVKLGWTPPKKEV